MTPPHGFRDAEDYGTRSAAKPWMGRIAVPTLILSARNDPLLPASCLPGPAEVSSQVILEYPATGGHAGFPSGLRPGGMDWLPKRLLTFFARGR